MDNIKFRLLNENKYIVGYEKWFEGNFNSESQKDYYINKPQWVYSKDNIAIFKANYIEHRYKNLFTGFVDREGKEIYEDDMLELTKTNRKGLNIQGHPGSSWDEKCDTKELRTVYFNGLEFTIGEHSLKKFQWKYNEKGEKMLVSLCYRKEHMVGYNEDTYENFKIAGNKNDIWE